MDQEEVAILGGEEYFERVPEWTVEDVVNWLNKVGFGEYISVFEQCGVEGK